jgi:dipeptidase
MSSDRGSEGDRALTDRFRSGVERQLFIESEWWEETLATLAKVEADVNERLRKRCDLWLKEMRALCNTSEWRRDVEEIMTRFEEKRVENTARLEREFEETVLAEDDDNMDKLRNEFVEEMKRAKECAERSM